MKAPELRTHLLTLLSEAESAAKLAKTAEDTKQSIAGHGRYADPFHRAVVTLTATEKKVRPHLGGLGLPDADVAKFDAALTLLKATSGKAKPRTQAVRELKLLCETAILPKAEAMTASPIPTTELVLPLDVVQGDWVLVKIVTQINGCYEHQWYDACSVMVRKLAEFLIIALFEKNGVAQEIKDNENNFLMLSKLISKLETKTEWGLGRETKPFLKLMKELGDRAAHNRTYVATKGDLDKLLGGLRVAVSDLMVRAGLRASP